MAYLSETNTYTGGIYQIERTDPVDAGIGGNGVANLQALQLANRTRWLKGQLEALQAGTTLSSLTSTGVTALGGSGSQGDYTINSGTVTLDQSEYFFRDFTIGPGATVIIPLGARILARVVTISGLMRVTPIPGSGGTGVGFAAAYGQQLYGSLGSGFGGGKIGIGGNSYPYAVFPCGSGGGCGSSQIAPGDIGGLGAGGDGGGGLQIEAQQIIISGTVEAKGSNASAPQNTTGTANSAGGGGGSGGVIILKALSNIIVSGTIDVRGGAASDPVGATAPAGGGGGGGIIALLSPSINTTGSTIRLSGGSEGTGNGAASYGGGGGGCGGAGGTQNQAGSIGVLLLRQFLAN